MAWRVVILSVFIILSIVLVIFLPVPIVVNSDSSYVSVSITSYAPAYQEMIPMGEGDRVELSGSHGEENWLAVSSDYKDIPVFEDRLSTESIKTITGVTLDSRNNVLTIDPKSSALGWTSERIINIISGKYELYGGETYADGLTGNSRVSETRAKFQDSVSGTGVDLYELEDTPQGKITDLSTSTIHSIDGLDVWAECISGKARTVIKVDGREYYGEWVDGGGTAKAYYDVNPATGKDWTFAEFDKLQAGIELDNGIATRVNTRIKMGIGSQTFYPIDAVEVTPGSAGAWTDVDVSAHVPAGATGVVLHLAGTYAAAPAQELGLRKKGSTDNRHQRLAGTTHSWAAIGVDGDRKFQAYIGSLTANDLILVGYTMTGVTFFTNAADKSLGSTSSWIDIDCSVEAPSSTGLIFELSASSTTSLYGMRQNGSTDGRTGYIAYHNAFGIIIGCDIGQISEGYIGSTTVDFFLVGYITDGCTFYTNATDVSLGSTGAWVDLVALPSGAVMGFMEAHKDFTFGLRKNGSSENIYKNPNQYTWAFVECDANGIIEGKISSVSLDFFVVGYAETPVPSLTNAPTSTSFGIVAASTTYYAKGSPPNNPVVDGDCTFTITNDGSIAIDIDMKIADFTGGVGWNIVAGVPGSNEVRITAYYSGQNPASGLVLANTNAEFYDGLAASATKKWDFKFETGTFTDGAAKTGILTITAAAED